jgi:hypothetical protein
VSIKQHYWADLKIRSDRDNSIVALLNRMMAFDIIYGISWHASSMNPVMLAQSWRKLVPYCNSIRLFNVNSIQDGSLLLTNIHNYS